MFSLENLGEDIQNDEFIKVTEDNKEKYKHLFEGKTNKNKKRKMKKESQFDDYYDFMANKQNHNNQNKNYQIEVSDEEDDEELIEENLYDEDYLKKRKLKLQKKFKQEIKAIKN